MGRFMTAILIGLWWICSIWANVYSKKVFLDLHDFALQLTFAQTSTAVFIVGLLFEGKLFKKEYFSELIQRISIKGVVILSLLHAFGNLFTNVSMESTNVAFAHTIKAAEPIFTIYFSRLMGKHEPFSLYLATIPVMLGVAISSLAEVKFSVLGFTAAVLSNSCFAYRNVSVKKLEEGDNLGIFFLVSCGSSIILALIHALKTTFHEPAPGYDDFADAFFNLVCASVLHCSYNIFSFLVLGQVAPLTHAVINLVKRGAVIFVAIIAFATPVNVLNMTGIFTTLAGGALFSLIRLRLNQKKAGPNPDEEEAMPTVVKQQPRPSFLKFTMILGFVLLAAAVSKPSPGLRWILWEETDGVAAGMCPTEESMKPVWEKPQWEVTEIKNTKVPIICMFGYTGLQRIYHFGQYGATYIADREVRNRFGEDAIIVPMSPLDQMLTYADTCLELGERVVFNWEGTFHGVGQKNKELIGFLEKITAADLPTYHMNIAWYPTIGTEKKVANLLQQATKLEHLSARDIASYTAMQSAGLEQTKQAADLTFLLPNNFSCEVNQFYAEKNTFWTFPGKLRVIVTYTSAESDVKHAIANAIRIMTDELEGRVEIVSVLDQVTVGVRTLAHASEDSIYEAMWLLKQADLVITGRFHCGTFARLAGVPTVLLPGNTPKVDQLAQMINSPAYPMVNKPEREEDWGHEIWSKAKEALAYAKQHPTEDDGILDKLHKMARNNFPIVEDDSIFNLRTITMDELRRQISFSSTVRNLTLTIIAARQPPQYGISYNTHQGKYILHELV